MSPYGGPTCPVHQSLLASFVPSDKILLFERRETSRSTYVTHSR